ncbi:hypothetical protein HID58_079864, partial [Brassica napus]
RNGAYPWKLVEARCLGNLERHVALASSRSISGYIARKSGSKWEHVFSGFFYSPLLQMSRGYEDKESLIIFSGSFAGGRATMFPALGQGFFRGTTPMEFDECSKALCPPSYHNQSQQEPKIVEVGF